MEEENDKKGREKKVRKITKYEAGMKEMKKKIRKHEEKGRRRRKDK
jgi:hypothetical protein